MKKKLYISLAVLFVVVIVVVAYVSGKASSDTSDQIKQEGVATSSPIQNSTNPGPQEVPEGQPITVTGAMDCISPESVDGRQVGSCAIGVKADDGKQYNLNMSDPMAYGSLPTGQRVQISGKLVGQLIYVDSLQKL